MKSAKMQCDTMHYFDDGVGDDAKIGQNPMKL